MDEGTDLGNLRLDLCLLFCCLISTFCLAGIRASLRLLLAVTCNLALGDWKGGRAVAASSLGLARSVSSTCCSSLWIALLGKLAATCSTGHGCNGWSRLCTPPACSSKCH